MLKLKRLLWSRKFRLYLSLVLALLVLLITRNSAGQVVSFLYTWITFAAVNLISSWAVIFSFHPAEVKKAAKEEDSSRSVIFLLVVAAAFISLFAIILLLHSVPQARGLNIHILLSFSSVFCSWFLVHTIFTLRYAHLFYQGLDKEDLVVGSALLPLNFPNEPAPDYIDFAYFSFVIGMTFQVSDVNINDRRIRRLALLHGLLAFIYNTIIVAFTINIVSGIISK